MGKAGHGSETVGRCRVNQTKHTRSGVVSMLLSTSEYNMYKLNVNNDPPVATTPPYIFTHDMAPENSYYECPSEVIANENVEEGGNSLTLKFMKCWN